MKSKCQLQLSDPPTAINTITELNTSSPFWGGGVLGNIFFFFFLAQSDHREIRQKGTTLACRAWDFGELDTGSDGEKWQLIYT